jgi:WXXGXW repeat (2 copies)
MQITRLSRLFLALMVLTISASSFAGVVVSVAIAPPALPVYAQPPCPGDGYIWTPGYWAYGPQGYYWVPGTWVVAPQPGLLWTPGYWGWAGGAYIWHAGYWGPHVGFYGGVNYGFGYVGVGYVGGYWHGNTFFYNRAVNHITVTNVHIYNKTVINDVHVTRVSFNGGPGGINMRPSRGEEIAAHERHFEATRMQIAHENGARANREFLASVNHGRPAIAATARPGEFRGHGAVGARNAGAPRPMDNRAMNHGVPRPQNSARPMNHGGNNPRPGNHEPAPRPASYRGDNNRGHESAPHPEKEERGKH